MKKRKKYQHRDKPWMCDPGMCDHCVYIGEGDFICDKGPVSRSSWWRTGCPMRTPGVAGGASERL